MGVFIAYNDQLKFSAVLYDLHHQFTYHQI